MLSFDGFTFDDALWRSDPAAVFFGYGFLVIAILAAIAIEALWNFLTVSHLPDAE